MGPKSAVRNRVWVAWGTRAGEELVGQGVCVLADGATEFSSPFWFFCPLPHARKASAVELGQLEANNLVFYTVNWKTPDGSFSSVCK